MTFGRIEFFGGSRDGWTVTGEDAAKFEVVGPTDKFRIVETDEWYQPEHDPRYDDSIILRLTTPPERYP